MYTPLYRALGSAFLAGVVAAFACSLVGAEAPNGRAGRPKFAEPPPEADTSRVTTKRPFDRVMVFKETPQGKLSAHLYLPPGWAATDRRPAIVFWVGGGFRSGGVGQFNARAEYFANRGLVTVCAEYRGRNSHGILLDSCAEDARSAMRWVKGHASELGVDPKKVIAGGGSAGGCLALLVARAEGPDAPDDDLSIPTRPCAMLLFNPAVGDGVMDTVGWGGPAQEAVNDQISVLDTPRKDEPPAIFFFGTEDRFLRVSAKFNHLVHEQGGVSELWVAEKMGHGFFNNQPWHDETTRLADDFLVRLGYLSDKSPIRANTAAVLRHVGPDYVPPALPGPPPPRTYDIPASTAETALRLFAQQSGMTAVLAANAPRDIRTKAVKGDFVRPGTVLEKLLAGTGLKATTVGRGSNAWVISKAGVPIDPPAELARSKASGSFP
ncbi:MAG: alpha/beta hydrolase [Opitutaceae bacterium]|nr:alpha/beta hydrolase [Opitutaceae bacterium]